MTSGLRILGLLGLVVGLAIGVASCSDKTGADKFVGSWTYAGAINPNCGDAAPIDLTGEMVTITASDSSHITMQLGTLCTVKFDVDGTMATAQAGQTCRFDIPGYGPVDASIKTWTLMVSGDTITSDFSGSVLICLPSGTGTLTRVSTDDGGGQ